MTNGAFFYFYRVSSTRDTHTPLKSRRSGAAAKEKNSGRSIFSGFSRTGEIELAVR